MAYDFIVELPNSEARERPDNVVFFPGITRILTEITDDPNVPKIMRRAATQLDDCFAIIGSDSDGNLRVITQFDMRKKELIQSLKRVLLKFQDMKTL
jgi:hypothetical protein